MRIASILSLGLLLGACSHSRMRVAMLGPADLASDPVPAESLFVFTGEDRVLPKYQPIAQLSVGPKYWTNPGWDIPSVEKALLEKAGKLGADAVILGELSGFPYRDFYGTKTWGTATAIRFAQSGSARTNSAARQPRELKAIVVAPIAAPEDIHVPDTIAAGFVRDIRAELEESGFVVLPEGLYESVWDGTAIEAEGVADPITTLKNKLRTQSREQRTLRSLIKEHGADGFLFPDIQGVEASFHGDEASWDGISQKVGETRSMAAKVVSGIANLLVRGEGDFEEPDPAGSVWALSLVVQIENALGALLYTGRGGIELLEGADFEGGIYFGDPEPEGYKVVEIPTEQIFKKQRRLQRAVRIALSSLGSGGR